MPFAGYENFASCVRSNRDKRNPQAYCGTIMHAVEGKNHEYHVEIDEQMRNYGETHYGPEVIKINPTRGDVINTIIHERLHADNPQMEEDEVRKKSHEIEGEMSLPEMAGILLDTHAKSQEPKGREVIETIASKVIKSEIK